MKGLRLALLLVLGLGTGCHCSAPHRAADQAATATDERTSVAARGLPSGEVTGSAASGASAGAGPAGTAQASSLPTAGGSAVGARPSPPPAGAERATSCQAPSLQIREPIDARDLQSIGTCFDLRSAMGSGAGCGEGGEVPPLELDRLEASVLGLDQATITHVREIAQRGRGLGRNPRAFGLVGDSMTVSYDFMRPFSADRPGRFEVAPELRPTLELSLPGYGGSIVDYYRSAQVERIGAKWADSFAAGRAAKVGARSVWATGAVAGDAEERSPMATMVRSISPELVVLAYGGNDAAYRVAPPDEVARDFERDFGRVLDALERRGIVPILSTIARHGVQPGRADCAPGAADMSNWRLAVQTNAINAAVIDVACRRHLPLVDLRYALDGLPGRGLGKDGVHPTAFRGGAGMLTSRGMACGYNVRNYLTLRMLSEVKIALAESR